jgi:hypothetical protein
MTMIVMTKKMIETNGTKECENTFKLLAGASRLALPNQRNLIRLSERPTRHPSTSMGSKAKNLVAEGLTMRT